MADKIFAEGLHFDPPAANAPTWIIGKLSFRVRDFIPFLEQHVNENGFVTVDIKQSQGGKHYCELNTYRKAKKEQEAREEQEPQSADEINPDDIPF